MKRLIFAVCAALVLVLANPMDTLAQRRSPPSGGGGGGGGGQTAQPRGGGGGGRQSSPPPSSGGAVRRGGSGGGGQVTAPAQARARGDVAVSGQGRPPVYGRAVPRSQFPTSRIVVPSGYYGVSPWYYYSPYAYGTFGLGYWGWDPYWWGGGFGFGFGFGYGGYPYGGYGPYYRGYGPYYGGYGPYYGGYGPYYDNGYYRDDRGYPYGQLKLKVKPREAEVYLDGYYVGQVDDFDGSFQDLDLEAGSHRVEIRANGFQPLVFETRVVPGRTVKYEGSLKPSGGKLPE